jgi:hypothetical protein
MSAAPRNVDAGVGDLRRSLTHLGVRSLTYSTAAFASADRGADTQLTMAL